jgi:signal transduction histidine kinase
VRLAYTPELLVVTITNDGVGPTPDSPDANGGYGLIGMRERARSAGGRIHAGPRPGGGFEVVTELPVQPYRLEEPATA